MAAMTLSQSRLSDGRYLNWLKSTLSLLYLKNGIEGVIDTEAVLFHHDIQKKLGVYGSTPQCCISCTSTSIKADYRRRTWNMSCRLCDPWLQQIIRNHISQPLPKLSPANTDPQLWPTNAFEVFKLFMPYGCQQQLSAKDADIQCILSLVKNCLYFKRCGRIGRMDLIDDLLRIRNSLFHSGDFKVDDADLQRDMHTAIDFLQGLTKLSPSEHKTVYKSLDQITKLQTGILDLSLNKEMELHALQLKQNALDTELKRLTIELNEHKDHTSTTEDDVAHIQTDVKAHEIKLSEVDVDVKNLQISSASVTAKASETYTELKTQSAKIESLELSIEELQEIQEHLNNFLQTHDLEQDMKRLSMCIQHHEQRIQNLETHLRTTSETQAVTEYNLRQILLSAYKEMFKHIPIFPEKTLDLEELYVQQEFKLIDHYRKAEAKDQIGNDAFVNKSIARVADIFNKKNEICKNILISSEPGLGKSIFCKHLVRLWYNGYTLDDAALTMDQQTLKGFKLLFYIDLRDATILPKAPKSDEIATMIYDILELSNKCSIQDISKFLSDSSVLVVMDSLDELGSRRCPNRGLHNNSCIVITSRPWKIEALRLQLSHVDQHIEIVGLAKSSASSLANNVLQLLATSSEDRRTKTSDNFIQDMEIKELQHFFNTPLLVVQMLGLWFSGESFGDSPFEIYSKVIHQQLLIAVQTKDLLTNVDSSLKRNFPCCNSSNQCPCKDYGELLWKVAKMAYLTLFSKERQMCLIFDHVVTEYYDLSTDEVELCLNIGILTQHRFLVNNPIETKKNVSFPHKTNQEYFASIFLKMSDLDHIRSVTSNLDQALELDKVLLFCSQVNPTVAHSLSHLISVKADEDQRVKKYRQTGDINGTNYADLIKKMQNIIIMATQKHTALFLSDIVLYNPSWPRTENRNIFVHSLDITGVKSLHVEIVPVSSDELKTLEQFQRLQKLALFDSGIKVEHIHEMVVRNRDVLETLGLGGKHNELLDLSPLGEKFRDCFTANLSSIALRYVQLTHQQCQDFCKAVSSSLSLRQVDLYLISCKTHGWKSGDCLMLKFTRHTNLDTIKLWQLPVVDVNLESNTNLHTVNLWRLPVKYVSLNLSTNIQTVRLSELPDSVVTLKIEQKVPQDTQLNTGLHTIKLLELPAVDVKLNFQTLQICEIHLPGNLPAQKSMMNSLLCATNLQEFTCRKIEDPQLVVKVLSQINTLRKIVLNDVDFGDLSEISVANETENLEKVELYTCKITDTGLSCLINSLPSHRVEVLLKNCAVKGENNFFREIEVSPNTVVKYDKVYPTYPNWHVDILFYNNTQQ